VILSLLLPAWPSKRIQIHGFQRTEQVLAGAGPKTVGTQILHSDALQPESFHDLGVPLIGRVIEEQPGLLSKVLVLGLQLLHQLRHKDCEHFRVGIHLGHGKVNLALGIDSCEECQPRIDLGDRIRARLVPESPPLISAIEVLNPGLVQGEVGESIIEPVNQDFGTYEPLYDSPVRVTLPWHPPNPFVPQAELFAHDASDHPIFECKAVVCLDVLLNLRGSPNFKVVRSEVPHGIDHGL
jgi:hypothetical protein